MIAVSITEPSSEKIIAAILKSSEEADILEIRLDCLEDLSLENILKTAAQVLAKTKKPLILTLRSKKEGGYFKNDIKAQLEISLELLKLKPDFLDIELGWPGKFYKLIAKAKNETKIIASYHNLKRTLSDYGLRQIIRRLAWTKADILKLVSMATDTASNLRVLKLIDFTESRYKKPAICFCMGEKGLISRVLTESMSGYLTFCQTEEGKASAPGQITVKKLKELQQTLNLTNQDV